MGLSDLCERARTNERRDWRGRRIMVHGLVGVYFGGSFSDRKLAMLLNYALLLIKKILSP
jgi:hypothetical protein